MDIIKAVSIGCDHGGFRLKQHLKEVLVSLGHEVIDRGCFDQNSVDYPDFAESVGLDVSQKRARFGVLVCTSGIGICISANKVAGVRAAVVHNEDAAHFCRLHNDANVICFGQKYDTPYMAEKCLRIFIETEFEGGRHERRVQKMALIQARHGSAESVC